jgi:hypothetical protein
VVTVEDTMVEAGGVIMADITAVIAVDTMAASMAGVFTHIGDYGDGDIGDGLFWDGPMQAGPMSPMGGGRMWGGPTIHQR